MADFDSTPYGLGVTYHIGFVTQAKRLEELLQASKAAGHGIAGMTAAARAFCAQLVNINPGARSLDKVLEKVNAVRKVLAKQGINADDIMRQVMLAQVASSTNKGNNAATQADIMAKFDSTQYVPGGDARWILAIRNIGMVTLGIQRLTRTMHGFVDATARSSREMYLLAVNAQTTVSEIAKVGGAFEAFGGSKGDGANFLRSFAQEMAKMQVGQGVGGKYMEAARLYGIGFTRNPEEFFLNVARFMSDPNKSSTQKVGLASVVGLSSAEMSLASRGTEAVKREWAIQKELHKEAENSSKAMDDYKRSVQHLSAAFEDLKTAALVPFAKAMIPVIEWLTKLAMWMRDSKIGRIFYHLIAFAVGAAAISKTLAIIMTALKAAGWIGGAGGAITKLASKAAGAAGSITGSLGAGSAGWTGAATAAGSVGTGVVTAINGYYQSDTALATQQSLQLAQEQARNGSVMASAMAGFSRKMGNEKSANRILELDAYLRTFKSDGIRNSAFPIYQATLLQEIATATEEIKNHTTLISESYKGKGGAGGGGMSQVTIENIDINVSSDSADAGDVADSVRDKLLTEMRNVVMHLDPGGRA